LRNIDRGEGTAEDTEVLLDSMKSANAMLAHSAMLEAAGFQTRINKGGVEAELYAKAREIAARDGITEERALGRVRKEHPELAGRYDEETGKDKGRGVI